MPNHRGRRRKTNTTTKEKRREEERRTTPPRSAQRTRRLTWGNLHGGKLATLQAELRATTLNTRERRKKRNIPEAPSEHKGQCPATYTGTRHQKRTNEIRQPPTALHPDRPKPPPGDKITDIMSRGTLMKVQLTNTND